jgi:large subunit ribosomal protein L10
MGVPARFVGAPLRVFQKPQKRDLLLAAIQVGFPKRPWSLVAFVSVLLSETAGAGNGLIRKSLHRRVKTEGQVALRFKPRWPVQRKLGRGQDVTDAPRGVASTRRFLKRESANRRELVERAVKAEQIASLGEVFKTTKVVVVAHYSGLTVAQMQTLRRQMKQAGATVKVAKNRLAKIALEGSDVASIASLLKGPTLIAFSGDPVAAPKAAVDFAKTHERFVIIGGAMGKTALDPNGVKALAALPSLDELRAKIVGLIQAPATKIAQVVNAPAAKVARVVAAYAAKSGEEAAAA